jgi:hypothetical protein
LDGDTLTIGRLECSEWESPLLSFDMQESIVKIARRSRIRVLNTLFKQRFRGYKLVNYGPLDLANSEQA